MTDRTEENGFIALGPLSPGEAGFETHGTAIDIGGNFHGNTFGVLASSDNGVALAVGTAKDFGPAAEIQNRSTEATSTGVSGSSSGGTGVLGSGPRSGVRGTSVDGNGVSGFSQNNDAVRGDTGAAQKAGVFGFNSITDLTQCWGVAGSTGSKNPFSFGVFGFAENASGVGGNSAFAYGGHFSGGRAQIRLIPSSNSGPPAVAGHSAGELFVDSQGFLFYFNGTAWRQLA